MKKFTTITIVLCLVFTLLTGCSKGDDKKSGGDSAKADSGLDYNPDDYVTLGDYKGLEAYDVTFDATEDEVKESIDNSLQENATYSDITKRGAKAGDIITFDFSVTVDGKEVEDCKETGYEITLGNGEFCDAVEKKMIGQKAGAELEVSTEIPEDLSSTNGGDKGVFTVKITKLQEEKIPTYNLDYVKANSEYTTLEEYEQSVKESLISDKESEAYSNQISTLLQTAVDNSKYEKDYPKDLYTQCEEEFNSSAEESASMFGISADEYLKDFCGYDDDSIKEEILYAVHEKLLVYSIAQKEKLFLTDEEYKTYCEEAATQNEYESVEALEKDYSKDVIMYAAIYDKVGDLLLTNADTKTITEEEYNAMNAEEETEESGEEASADAQGTDADAEEADDAEATSVDEPVTDDSSDADSE